MNINVNGVARYG